MSERIHNRSLQLLLIFAGEVDRDSRVVAGFGADGTSKVIYTFSGADDRAAPLGSFVMDAARNLYGTGQGSSGGVFGEFFKPSPKGSGGWTGQRVRW